MKPLPFLLALLLALPAVADEVRELAWHEMIPPGAPPPAPPVPLHDLSQLGDTLLAESGPAAAQQQPAAPVVPELDGQTVRLPGYVVPLEQNDAGRVTEFLLVPYFGACIHVPPPPSNQIVLVHSELGLIQENLFQPYWVEGRLRVAPQSSELAETGYAMDASKIYHYEFEDE